MKKYFFFSAFLLLAFVSNATHNMAGDISYKHISGYTYRFTVRTFTNTNPAVTSADRCELSLNIGVDSIVLPRINGSHFNCPATADGENICPFINYNLYVGDITLPGEGVYQFQITDLNMSAGICNVASGSSVNEPFTLKGEMVINNILGSNDSPEYTSAALINDSVGVVSFYNPHIINTENDSLYFDFSIPTGWTLPPASTSMNLNTQTGEIVWNAPTMLCTYVIDVTIKEYRRIGASPYYYVGTTMQEIYTANCATTLFVNENISLFDFIISPNPFKSQTTISFSEKQKNVEFKILNILGEVLRTQNFSGNEFVIEQNKMNSGIYIVQLNFENGRVENKKIIVQ